MRSPESQLADVRRKLGMGRSVREHRFLPSARRLRSTIDIKESSARTWPRNGLKNWLKNLADHAVDA